MQRGVHLAQQLTSASVGALPKHTHDVLAPLRAPTSLLDFVYKCIGGRPQKSRLFRLRVRRSLSSRPREVRLMSSVIDFIAR